LWTVFIHTTPYTETTAKVYSQEEDGIYEELGGEGGWVVAAISAAGGRTGRSLHRHTLRAPNSIGFFFFCFDFISLMLQAAKQGLVLAPGCVSADGNMMNADRSSLAWKGDGCFFTPSIVCLGCRVVTLGSV